MQTRIPAVYMRGGTSKGVIFHENHLPGDPEIRDRVILAAYGSPDPNRRQIDGVGGATSVTSKVAIVGPATDSDYDIVYNFGQVSIDRPVVDYKGSCGNIAAAVGAFAVDEALVRVEEPVTRVRIYLKNTGKKIITEVPVKHGMYDEQGDYSIDGVPGTGGKITIRYLYPGGSVTGKLFPTGHATDLVDVPGMGEVSITIIDVGNPWVLVRAKDLGLKGTEIEEVENDDRIRSFLEAVRSRAAVMIGFAKTPQEASQKSQAVPKIGFFSEPQTYQALSSAVVYAKDIDLVGRVMSMGMLHKSMAVSCPMAVAAAAAIEGTTIYNILGSGGQRKAPFKLGHPGGIFDVQATVEQKGDQFELKEAAYGRTARRLMEGYVLVPERALGA
ncbi:MAG: 3-methylitaconate isomerase [Deltaproteobacteria bacterium]|nr:3-methylitaconate isomerase [Deltaproteobacteria bacterium]MBW2150504.1 3-methylitaconate isomerase [Deltaproteobacteria bacterium]